MMCPWGGRTIKMVLFAIGQEEERSYLHMGFITIYYDQTWGCFGGCVTTVRYIMTKLICWHPLRVMVEHKKLHHDQLIDNLRNHSGTISQIETNKTYRLWKHWRKSCGLLWEFLFCLNRLQLRYPLFRKHPDAEPSCCRASFSKRQ